MTNKLIKKILICSLLFFGSVLPTQAYNKIKIDKKYKNDTYVIEIVKQINTLIDDLNSYTSLKPPRSKTDSKNVFTLLQKAQGLFNSQKKVVLIELEITGEKKLDPNSFHNVVTFSYQPNWSPEIITEQYCQDSNHGKTLRCRVQIISGAPNTSFEYFVKDIVVKEKNTNKKYHFDDIITGTIRGV